MGHELRMGGMKHGGTTGKKFEMQAAETALH